MQLNCAEVVLAQERRVCDAVVGVEVIDVARTQVHRNHGVDLVIQAEVGDGLRRVTHLGALGVEGELLTSNGFVLVIEYSRLEVGSISPVTQREHTDDLQAIHGVVVHFQFETVVLNVDAAELRRAVYGHGIVYNDAHPLRDEAVTPVGGVDVRVHGHLVPDVAVTQFQRLDFLVFEVLVDVIGVAWEDAVEIRLTRDQSGIEEHVG